MKKQQIVTAFGVFCVLFVAVNTASAQGEMIVAELGGVSVVSIGAPVEGYPEYWGSQIVLRSAPGTSQVTFENLSFKGNVVQTWLSGVFGVPTAKGAPEPSATYDASWIPLDSHVLITDSMVGGGAGGSYGGIDETNDMVIGLITGLPPASGFDPVSGLGDLQMGMPTDAFFLGPADQSNEIQLGYFVIEQSVLTAGGNTMMTLGVLGDGIVNSGDENGASFGFSGNPLVAIHVPEPATGLLAGLGSLVLLGIRRRLFA